MQRKRGLLQGNFRYVAILSFLAGLLFHLVPVTNVFGRDVSFQWTANTDTPPVDGYRLYYKLGVPGADLTQYYGTNANGGNPSPVQVPGPGTTSYTLQNLLDSEKYSFVLTAYRSQEESPPTNAIVLDAIIPPPVNLTARINTNVLSGESPLQVIFDATTSTGNIVTYAWLFGDGTTGSGSMTSHTFSSAGNYTVTLQITDTIGATAQATVSIVVTSTSNTNNPPTAVLSSSLSVGTAPLSIAFDGSASTDSDGSIVSYGWDFGDGGTANGALVNYTYNTAGTFNARLTVTDNTGLTGTTVTPVLVSESTGNSNVPPTAIISTSARNGYAPLSVSFNAGQSYDSDGNINSYTWSFGDGTVAAGVNVTHEFLQPAVYTVTLKVKDDQGASSLPATVTVNVMDAQNQKESLTDTTVRLLMGIYHLLLGP